MAGQLVELPEVQRLSPACIRILGGNPNKFTLQGTNTYLLGTGADRLLIDTGEGKPSWISALKRTLDEEHASVSAALITHWHHDHQGGIAQLLEVYPSTRIYKNQARPGDTPGQADIPDGRTFAVEGATLTAAHTPGHTVDHVAFALAEEDALFTGDNVLGQGTAVFEDLAAYLDSLARMGGLFGGRAYPGHGPVVEDGPGKVREYIAHRHQREQQVVQTLRGGEGAGSAGAGGGDGSEDGGGGGGGGGGAWTAMELVKVIYRDVPENLHLAAQGGVVQILQKLEKEGRVSQEDGRWRLLDRSTL